MSRETRNEQAHIQRNQEWASSYPEVRIQTVGNAQEWASSYPEKPPEWASSYPEVRNARNRPPPTPETWRFGAKWQLARKKDEEMEWLMPEAKMHRQIQRIRKLSVWCQRQNCTVNSPGLRPSHPLLPISRGSFSGPVFWNVHFDLILRPIHGKNGSFYQFGPANWREIHEIFPIWASE